MTEEKNLATEVQKIRCPDLNKSFRGFDAPGAVEVFVRFKNNEPLDIMGCPEYRDGDGGCSLREAQGMTKTYLPCRYSKWKAL